MNKIRLLIVDDIEDNRLVLRAICKKLEEFEIREAQDGLEAVETTRSWSPHIILMDIMMPIMDGFEASKIIKAEYPEAIIMAVTAVIDPQIEQNMASIGVSAYIRKPIDKNLIRFKLQNFASLLHSNSGNFKALSKKEALNPFCNDVRNFKTIFEIADAEAMMDFGMWVLARCQSNATMSCTKVDNMIELFYELVRQAVNIKLSLSVIAEESFDELFFTMRFQEKIEFSPKIALLTKEMGSNCMTKENFVCTRLKIQDIQKSDSELKSTNKISRCTVNKKKSSKNLDLKKDKKIPEKKAKTAYAQEKESPYLSFTGKTTAEEYMRDIGCNISEEIEELMSLDEEWEDKLSAFEEEPTIKNLYDFTDNVLSAYSSTINSLFEFEAFAYALSSLKIFLKEKAGTITQEHEKTKTLIALLKCLGSDLRAWREHIFNLQDALDIHYLDNSFFSSCVQIEGLIDDRDTEVNSDTEIKFF